MNEEKSVDIILFFNQYGKFVAKESRNLGGSLIHINIVQLMDVITPSGAGCVGNLLGDSYSIDYNVSMKIKLSSESIYYKTYLKVVNNIVIPKLELI